VSTGFVERKKNKKSISLVPSHSGISLVTVLPEQLQSPLLTAEWEYRLKEVERGELSPEQFLDGISDMVATLVQTYQPVLGAESCFLPDAPLWANARAAAQMLQKARKVLLRAK
jgi:DNA topoisomerase-3